MKILHFLFIHWQFYLVRTPCPYKIISQFRGSKTAGTIYTSLRLFLQSNEFRNLSIDGFRSGGRGPSVNNFALFVDKEFLKVPLQQFMRTRQGSGVEDNSPWYESDPKARSSPSWAIDKPRWCCLRWRQISSSKGMWRHGWVCRIRWWQRRPRVLVRRTGKRRLWLEMIELSSAQLDFDIPDYKGNRGWQNPFPCTSRTELGDLFDANVRMLGHKRLWLGPKPLYWGVNPLEEGFEYRDKML